MEIDSVVEESSIIYDDELKELKSRFESNDESIILVEEPQIESKINQIKHLIEEFKLRTSWFNCAEPFTFSKLFGRILNKILSPEYDLNELIEFTDQVLENMAIKDLQNFIYKIEAKFKKIKYKNQIVILENADYLAESDPEFIQNLAKINDLIVGLKFTTVLISSFKIDHFKKLGIVFKNVYRIELLPSTHEQIKQFIISNRPNRFEERSYSNFVKTIVDGHANVCRNLNKFKYICELFYNKYLNENASNENSNRQMNEIKNQITFLSKHHNEIENCILYLTTNKLEIVSELTYCAKYLLIAAYLASYNSTSTDKRFFSKDQGDKMRKNSKSAFAKEDRKKIFGPAKFTFERLFQIYAALQDLTEDKEAIRLDDMKTKSPTNQLFEQFQTFISLDYIRIAEPLSSRDPYSSSAKYIISESVSNTFIKGIAATMEIDLDRFLERNILK